MGGIHAASEMRIRCLCAGPPIVPQTSGFKLPASMYIILPTYRSGLVSRVCQFAPSRWVFRLWRFDVKVRGSLAGPRVLVVLKGNISVSVPSTL